MAIPHAPKLRLAPLWPALAALVVVALTAGLLLPSALSDEVARDLEQTLQVLVPSLPPPRTPATVPDIELQRLAAAAVAGTDFRLTLIAIDGRVLADSERTLDLVAAMENHAGRPEVAAAREQGQGWAVRRSATIGIEFAYAARLVRGPDGVAWIARLSRPVRSLAHFRAHLAELMGISALVAALMALMVSIWLTRSLFRPLSGLIDAARRIADGDYTTPVETPQQEELARLGRALAESARSSRQQIAELAEERDHLDAIVGSLSEGLLVTDHEGRDRLVNPAFRTLFGIAPSAAAGEILDLIREPRLGDLIARVLSGSPSLALTLERSEPITRHVAVLASPLSGGGGCVVLARDVTEAERLHQMRKDFVANVSHELKTPLAAIRGYAETLVDGAVEEPETAARFSRRILEQCRRLGELLDDLLTLSRLEGTEPLRALEPVDLREVAEEALELVVPRAQAKAIRPQLEPGPPVIVRGDADGLVRLFVNLLDNAIKYNLEAGQVRVRISTRGDEAVLEVSDSGIGIVATHLTRIFERFYRVDKGRTREEGGTGLGLAIVKHVAQAHDGRVEVESEPGRGSTFRVLLPLRATA